MEKSKIYQGEYVFRSAQVVPIEGAKVRDYDM